MTTIWPSSPITSAHVDWYLAVTRLNGVRRRVEREGLDGTVRAALLEVLADLEQAAVKLDGERTTPPTSRDQVEAGWSVGHHDHDAPGAVTS